jgi:uncharacterized protein YaaQ
MKMIIAIMEDHFSSTTSKSLVQANYRVTRLASTGGFFREGATTLMVGVEDERLEDALDIIREQIPGSTDPDQVQATIFVLNVKDHRRI